MACCCSKESCRSCSKWLEVEEYEKHLNSGKSQLCKLYVKLKRYKRVPRFLEKEGDLFVARCEYCQDKPRRRKCRFCTRFEKIVQPNEEKVAGLKTPVGVDESDRPKKYQRVDGNAETVAPSEMCERCEKFEKVPNKYPPKIPETGKKIRKYVVSLEVRCTKCSAKSFLLRCPKGELLDVFYRHFPKSLAEEKKELISKCRIEPEKKKMDPEFEADIKRLNELEKLEDLFREQKISTEANEESKRQELFEIKMDEYTLTSDDDRDDFRYWSH